MQFSLFDCFGEHSGVVYENEFFWSVGQVFGLKSFCTAVSRKRLQSASKTGLTTTGLFLQLLLEYASFFRFHICMDWYVQDLLNW